MSPHPAFARSIALAYAAQATARQATTRAARNTALGKCREHLRLALDLAADADDIRQLRAWMRRVDRRGRPAGARNKKNRPPKMVEMFPPMPEGVEN
jgi:hypothetical protein